MPDNIENRKLEEYVRGNSCSLSYSFTVFVSPCPCDVRSSGLRRLRKEGDGRGSGGREGGREISVGGVGVRVAVDPELFMVLEALQLPIFHQVGWLVQFNGGGEENMHGL